MKLIGRLNHSLSLLTLTFVLTFGLLMFFPQSELSVSAEGGTDDTAGASEQKFEHYEPLPVEPIHREANNVLLSGGLVFSALILGVAFVLDKRNEK